MIPHSGIASLRSRRALLYMPGHDRHKIEKAISSGVDCLCMDMEDGVAPNRKLEARAGIVSALQTLNFGRSEYLARINSIDSEFAEDDLDDVLPAKPQGIVLPKVEHADQIKWVSNKIESIEQRFGWPSGEIILIAIVESARGIINLKEIASADSRLKVVIFGADDLAVDTGAQRSRAGWEVFYARSAVVTHAAAFNLQAIDMVFIDFNDIEGLRHEAEEGARFGFVGKQIIHPNQIIPVQAAFTPSTEEIENAQRIIAAYDQQSLAGTGAFAIDGKMIDAPLVKSAQRVLERAHSSGII
jgi:citrate lyase beta subunit